jgi:hypothetical protein
MSMNSPGVASAFGTVFAFVSCRHSHSLAALSRHSATFAAATLMRRSLDDEISDAEFAARDEFQIDVLAAAGPGTVARELLDRANPTGQWARTRQRNPWKARKPDWTTPVSKCPIVLVPEADVERLKQEYVILFALTSLCAAAGL